MPIAPGQARDLWTATARLLVLGVVVGVTTWISIRYARQFSTVSTVWASSGLLAAVLLTSPRRRWRGYLLVAFAASLIARVTNGDPWFSILGISIANVLEAGMVAFVLTTYVDDWTNPRHIKRVGWVSVSANLGACAFSAVLVATLLAGFSTESFWTVLLTWFASHTLGMAIFSTLIGIALNRGRQLFGRPGHRVELALTLALIAAVCLVVFSQPQPLLFMIYPPLMFCLFRHRFDGAVLGIAVIVVISIAETLSGHGPLYLASGSVSTESSLLLQLFLAVTCLLTFPVAIVLTESSFLTRGLRASEQRHRMLAETLEQSNVELAAVNQKLSGAQSQLLQSAKMASVGQLAAGVAHEINNPIGYVRSNLTSLSGYMQKIFSVIQGYEQLEKAIMVAPPELAAVRALKQHVELDYVREDIVSLLAESVEGVTRVEKIVKDLKDFSHVDQPEWQQVNIHDCIDSTLNVVAHELKYKADVVKEYGHLPAIECFPFQIEQVFMNLLVNAAHAIEGHGTVTIRTGCDVSTVWASISDTGKGISPADLERIYEPFFTTKPVGVGTGLGLSVSFGIIKKHGGAIEVASVLGSGTTFTVRLPIAQTHDTTAA